jgi:hypothetical protein
MSKVNSKLSVKLYVLLFLLLSIISCDIENTEETGTISRKDAVSPTFMSNDSKSSLNMYEILNGTWESFDSGSKAKWIFSGDELLKSNIYSFGEAGNPQKYTVVIQVACGGKKSDAGEFVSLTSNDDAKEAKSVCYEIVSYSNSEIKLTSKHGHTIILKK